MAIAARAEGEVGGVGLSQVIAGSWANDREVNPNKRIATAKYGK
jgi:hypothetical protein